MSSLTSSLDERKLIDALGDASFVRRIELLGTTGSTNDDARRLARDGAPSGTVVVADAQTEGRGRLGRVWHSAPGLGVYISVLVRTTTPADRVTRWTLGASLAACQACRSVGGEAVEVRWPNDLYHDGRKLAGTLLELRTSGHQVQELIVGTGFNANHGNDDFPEDLRDRATSLRIVTGAPVDREKLTAAYLRCLSSVIARLEEDRWDEIRASWAGLAPGASGARVRVTPGSGDVFEGTTQGVESTGALRIESADGKVFVVRLADAVTWLET